MKSHIFAGEVQLNSKLAKDFAWVTKDELTNYFQPEYLKGVEDLLSN
jgi:large subunit ribosomal protein L46